MDSSALENIGLTKSEIKTYLSLLELGSTTSGAIIIHSQQQSSVVHRSIKMLVEKGFVTSIKIGKDNHYHACEPEFLIHYVEEKKKTLQDILPELKKRQKKVLEPNQTEMFFGKRAIFTMLNSLIADGTAGEEYYSFSLGQEHEDKEIIGFYTTHNIRRRSLSLKVRVLSNVKVKKIYERNYSKKVLQDANIRYTRFSFPQGIIIFRNVVIFLNWKTEPTAVRITNKTMASQFKEFFMEFYNKEKPTYK